MGSSTVGMHLLFVPGYPNFMGSKGIVDGYFVLS